MNKGKTFTHLSNEERIKIEVLLQAGNIFLIPMNIEHLTLNIEN